MTPEMDHELTFKVRIKSFGRYDKVKEEAEKRLQRVLELAFGKDSVSIKIKGN